MVVRRLLIAALAVAPLLVGGALPALAADPVVFAAASLKNALDDIAATYTEKTGKTVTISYAGTATLVRQIEQGAPADIFFSADMAWMDYAVAHKLVRPETRRTLLGNEIVLIVPKESTATIKIAPGMDLAGLIGRDGRLAMANVDAVPAGRYGKAALENLGVWESVAGACGAVAECPPGARLRRPRRGAGRHRLRHRCLRRAGGEDHRHLSRRQPRADPLSCRHDRRLDQPGREGLLRFSAVGSSRAGLSPAGIHRRRAGILRPGMACSLR